MTTASPFIRSGSRLQLPSGSRATIVRWASRHIDPKNRAEGMERIAIVQIEGGIGNAEFSERFMQLCQVVPS